ncbi:MAG TPA: hypothetical protein VKZ74_03615 [Natronosporangium sp.]|nr:hypothetical protein [Natronosporangium sp.]
MPPVSPRPHSLQFQVFRSRDALRQGLLTPAQLRNAAWRRVLRGVYADSRLEPDHLLRCQAAALLAPAAAAIAGPSAAYLHGIESAAGPEAAVHLAVEPKQRFGPVNGLRIHTGALPETDRTVRHGLNCTTPLRTAWDLAMWLDPLRAVPTLDAMLGSNLVAPADLARLLQARRELGARGTRRAGRVFALADGRAQSPAESLLRVKLVLRGIPPPVPQHPIRVRSGRVLHPDLAWPRYRVALEYDGGYHADPDQLDLDRRRLNQLTDAGWLVLHATARRLYREFESLQYEVRRALRSRGAPI